ncbi:MAG: site-specific DNA-methyltransferase [Planctomycetes bacterium]|nr:site-specific DNA-methyltransferase [Planctomycetota bacterium]
MRSIILGENSRALPTLPSGFARLAYVDPPFNTGRVQKRARIRAVATEEKGARVGFGGRHYQVEQLASASFEDRFDDFTAFLLPRLEAALRCLTPDGSLFVHLDAREVHYVKVELDRLLGRDHFMNEIIWAYDYGARTKSRWPAKHDSILWYVLDPEKYVFDFEAMDRIPYMAPGLVTREKAERGKTPTDVWWHTIVPTNGREKTGYPTQKPLGVIERIIKVHTEPGDVVLDFFAGSGTTGEAAAKNGRGFVLIDESREACQISAERLARFEPALVGFEVLTRSVAPLFASSSAPDRSAVPEPARSIPERDLETATEPSSSQPSAPGTALKP